MSKEENLLPHAPLSDPMIEEVTNVFLALADPSRLRILRCLLDAPEPMSQGAIAKENKLSPANTSKHLAFLVRVGLATRRASGQSVFFSPVLPLVEDVCSLICGHVSQRIKAAYAALN
jgi:DNA-binding transcriptional ArsR family regulator